MITVAKPNAGEKGGFAGPWAAYYDKMARFFHLQERLDRSNLHCTVDEIT
jgi:hypothetical protein